MESASSSGGNGRSTMWGGGAPWARPRHRPRRRSERRRARRSPPRPDSGPASARAEPLSLPSSPSFPLLSLEPRVDPLEEPLVASRDPGEPLENDSLVEGHHERDERVEGHLDPVAFRRLGERLRENRPPLVVDAREWLAQLRPVPGERLQLEPALLVGHVF